MKKISLISVSFVIFNFFGAQTASAQIPSLPPEPCYQNSCNEFMSSVYSDFLLSGGAPTLKPAVYSGTCRHLGMYSPDRDHYATVLLDQVDRLRVPRLESARFSTILAFFYERNEFADWDLAKARKEMSPYWLANGYLKLEDKTFRVEINNDDGSTAMIYWLRQNPLTQDLYYIFYSGTVMRSFCRLQLNSNQ